MKTFSQFIAEYRAGRMNELLTEELANLTKKVDQHMASGTMTIAVTLKPKGNGELISNIKFDSKPPRYNALESTLFTNAEGDLLTRDPRQFDLLNKENVKVVSDSAASATRTF